MKSMDLRTLAAAKIGRNLIAKIISYKGPSEEKEPERELSPLEKLMSAQGIKLPSGISLFNTE
jgi:hypothetical protein